MGLSAELAAKAVQASIAAIEIYNKPAFSYREEAFSLLMSNAWELLLKAKWIRDHDDTIESVYEYRDDGKGGREPKLNRSGNPMSLGATYIAAKLRDDSASHLEAACHDNLLALLEIRDNSAHFINKDPYLGRRVLEVGTASLRNFLTLATEWFRLDLSTYNFFLMPISFYHGFEAAEPATRAEYPEQVQRLLAYLDRLGECEVEPGAQQHVALRIETKLVRGKDPSAVEFRWTDDPAAPAITVREEDIFKNYPMTYKQLTERMKDRYEDFRENTRYHELRRPLEVEKKLVIVRALHPANPTSSRQRFYSPNIFKEFDKHYRRRKKS